MKCRFVILLDGSGDDLAKAYQDMRRKLLPVTGWADTDEAYTIDADGVQVFMAAEDVQDARKAWPDSRDGLRECRAGPGCRHDVFTAGLPICMMYDKEAKKLVKRAEKVKRRLQTAAGKGKKS